MEGPLKGIKVLDLTRVLSGPHSCMILGDLGADVIKIEKPGEGDMTRSNEPHYKGESTYFMAHNRNKRSMTLNFRKPKAIELFLKMVKTADVVVENFRAGMMETMGLDYDTLSRVNPGIILTRISGFGQDGPYSNRTCFDGAAQAMSGLIDITGPADGAPVMVGTYVIDYSAALYAVIGTLSALRNREITGKGQIVDVAMLDTALSFLHTAVPDYKLLGRVMERKGNNDRYMWPANIYPAKDGRFVYIHAGMENCYSSIMKVIGREDLLKNEKYGSSRAARSSPEGRAYNDEVITDWSRTKDADEIVNTLSAIGIPCAKVNNVAEIINDPQIVYRKMVTNIKRADGTDVFVTGPVIHFSDSVSEVELPPPLLGEHNQEILSEYGLSASEIKELETDGVI